MNGGGMPSLPPRRLLPRLPPGRNADSTARPRNRRYGVERSPPVRAPCPKGAVPMRIRAVFLTLVFTAAACGGPSAPPTPEPKTDEEKTIYAIGVALSRNIATFNLTPAELELVKA